MTLRQSLMKWTYPLVVGFGKLLGNKGNVVENNKSIQPVQSFYDLNFLSNAGKSILMSSFKGKKVLIVNTASDCGFTPQLEELQKLQDLNKDNLVVIGFPSNDFKEQEKGTNEEIEAFCKLNYGVSFLLAKKSAVAKNKHQNEVFKWLTHSNKNGWNDAATSWNFTKYLVSERGTLTHYFGSAVSPLSNAVQSPVVASRH